MTARDLTTVAVSEVDIGEGGDPGQVTIRVSNLASGAGSVVAIAYCIPGGAV
ncbi:MAG: hypothetical protein ACXWWL_05265 [Candidatus Limnocylindria bacterium]